MNPEAFKNELEISERFFGTETDPTQIPMTQSSTNKLTAIHPDTVLHKFDEAGNPIGWSVIIPTSLEVMNKFLAREITEKQLLDLAAAEKKREALYLCNAFVLPEHRRKGYAKALWQEGIRKLSLGKDLPLYYWAYSEEGRALANSLSRELGKTISTRIIEL